MRESFSNIFSEDVRKHLFNSANPKPGEMERVKKEIFQKLEATYPQFKHRSFLSVDNFFSQRFAFGFAIAAVLVVVGYSSLNEAITTVDEQLVKRTISPNETVLVKINPVESQVIAQPAVGNNVSTRTNNVTVLDEIVAVDNNASSVTNRKELAGNVLQNNVPVNQLPVSQEPESLVKVESSVAVAANTGQRAVVDGINNRIQIEYLISLE